MVLVRRTADRDVQRDNCKRDIVFFPLSLHVRQIDVSPAECYLRPSRIPLYLLGGGGSFCALNLSMAKWSRYDVSFSFECAVSTWE